MGSDLEKQGTIVQVRDTVEDTKAEAKRRKVWVGPLHLIEGCLTVDVRLDVNGQVETYVLPPPVSSEAQVLPGMRFAMHLDYDRFPCVAYYVDGRIWG